jgi:hypothetical protein
MRRPLAWAAVAVANLSAMTLFLWHQSAFLAVNLAGSLIGRLPGLLTAPSSPLWIAERLAWLPVFAAALAVLWLLFHRAEHGRAPRWLISARRLATAWHIPAPRLRRPISRRAEEMHRADAVSRELAGSR